MALKSLTVIHNMKKFLHTSAMLADHANSIHKCMSTFTYGIQRTRTYPVHTRLLSNTPNDKPLLTKLFPKPTDHNEKQNDEKETDEEEKRRREREHSWKTMKYTLAAFGFSFGAMGAWLTVEYGAPQTDENGNVILDEYSTQPIVQQYFNRMIRQLDYFKKMIQEPSREKLLPDIPEGYIYPPYTLVLELTDVLVHPEWTYQTGWRFKKRPGVDAFLRELAPPLYEIVVFTAGSGITAIPIVQALDPNGIIMYKLVKDATHFVDGVHIKNLDKLNRDLSKVIVVDWDKESVKFHPDNQLKIRQWDGNDDDTALIDLAAFLKTIATTGVEDVREILHYYRQFEDPISVFRENQIKMIELQEAQKELEASQPKSLAKNWTPSFLRR